MTVDYEIIGTAVFGNRNVPVSEGCTDLCRVISAIEIVFEVELIICSLNYGNINRSILYCEPADKVAVKLIHILEVMLYCGV